MKPLSKIISILLIWRLLLFLPVIVGVLILPLGSSVPFFEINYFHKIPEILDHAFIKAWANFDGVHYINIASKGYVNEGRFFPLLSIIIYILSIGNIYFPLTFLVALILPNTIFFAALFVFYKLLRLDYSENSAFDAIKVLLFYPLSFFFVSVYTEGLFLLLSVSCFYLIRKRLWWRASIVAMFLAATRFVGIFIIPALVYEFWITEKPKAFKQYLQIPVMSLISVLGVGAYSVFNYFKWGDFLYFLNAHTTLGNGRTSSELIIPLQTIYRYFKILTTMSFTRFEWSVALLELMSFLFASFLLFIAWRKKVRLSYLVFGSLVFFLPSFSGTFSGLPRYALTAFPVFIALALIQNKYIKISYYLASAVLAFILLMFFSRAYFIA